MNLLLQAVANATDRSTTALFSAMDRISDRSDGSLLPCILGTITLVSVVAQSVHKVTDVIASFAHM